MTLAFIAVVFGLALLVWSADRFVEGSASTSAPEMVVSALAASQGNPGNRAWQRLRFQHHQHRADPGGDGLDQPHRRPFAGAPPGAAHSHGCDRPGRMANLRLIPV